MISRRCSVSRQKIESLEKTGARGGEAEKKVEDLRLDTQINTYTCKLSIL